MRPTWQSGSTLRTQAATRALVAHGVNATVPFVERLDPYLIWASEIDAIQPTHWLPLLVELHDTSAEEFARTARLRWHSWMRVAPWYEHPPAGLAGLRHLCVWTTPAGLGIALSEPGHPFTRAVHRFALGRPSPHEPRFGDAPWPVPPFTASGASTSAEGVAVIGIVDDGIAFAHERLLDRVTADPCVRWFWDQSEAGPQPGFVPNGPVTYGIERPGRPEVGHPTSLSQLATRRRHAGLLDEDALYRDAGQRQAAHRGRHGTHVLDIAAGRKPGGQSRHRPVVAVQLPGAIVDDPGGTQLEPHLVDAVRYIVDRADRIAEADAAGGPMPIVANVSYGTTAGPHDGSSVFEVAMDELIAARERVAPVAVAVAAGNSARAQMHACVVASPNDAAPTALPWRVPPDSRTWAFLEVWIAHPSPGIEYSAIDVRVIPPVPSPDGPASVGPGGYAVLVDDAPLDPTAPREQRVLATVSYLPADQSAVGELGAWNDRPMVLIAVAPTAGHDPMRSWAPHGVWTIEIAHASGPEVEVHAWIRRNDVPYGTRAQGRQSRFEAPRMSDEDARGRPIEIDRDAYLGPVSAASTLNGIATGRRTTVVGAMRADRQAPTPYSSRGPAIAQPALPVHRIGPDLLGEADTSAAMRGVIAAGTRSGSAIALNGTSVATPAVVRSLAEALAEQAGGSVANALSAIVEAHPPGTDESRHGRSRLVRPVPSGRPPR